MYNVLIMCTLFAFRSLYPGFLFPSSISSYESKPVPYSGKRLVFLYVQVAVFPHCGAGLFPQTEGMISPSSWF